MGEEAALALGYVIQTVPYCAARGDFPLQRSAKRRGCLLSYSQAEPGRELMQPRKHLLAEPCKYDYI